MVVGLEGCRGGVAGAGFDLAVETPVVEPVDVGERGELDVIEEVVEEHLKPIKERTEQLIPNGGSSLRDAIDRIESRLDEIEAEIEEELA